jgi:hypothetical protein
MRGLRLRARHIAGKTNIVADRLSREVDGSDYKLDKTLFKKVCIQLNLKPKVDGFSSGWNHLLPTYITWKTEEGAESTNAMLADWGDGRIWWLHPPIPLLNQVIQKAIA